MNGRAKPCKESKVMRKRAGLLLLAIFLVAWPAGPNRAKGLSTSQAAAAWWDPDWHHRIGVKTHTGQFARADEPIELMADFAAIFSRLGITGTLDPNSIRVVDQTGPAREVLSQYESGSKEIIWLTGMMAAGTSKTYYVYFDTLENGPKQPPRYYSTLESGGILVLPFGDHVSVVFKIGGSEYEVARISEASGGIDYLKPPLGSALIDGEGAFLGFERQGVFEGGVTSITGGPIRYRLAFHYRPVAPESAVAYSDHVYTFYYVSGGREVRTKAGHRWAASRSFVPGGQGAERPGAFAIQFGDPGRTLDTFFRAAASGSAALYDLLAGWGPLVGDPVASPAQSADFWGVYGDAGGIGIAPITPDCGGSSVDGLRFGDGLSLSAGSSSQAALIEKGTYSADLWINGYDRKGWEPARDLAHWVAEPVYVTTDFVLFLEAGVRSDRKARMQTPADLDGPRFCSLAGSPYRSGPEGKRTRLTWLGPEWTYRRSLTFNNSGQAEDLADFPVLVKLTPGNFDYSHCQNDGRDIRFVDADDTTVLDYQIEQWNYGGDSAIWVRVPQVDGSSSADHIWMYYGNPAATDAQDPENVWDSDFLAVWHLSEGGTGTRYDSTANDHDGTPRSYDGDEATAGPIDGADELDGTNDYVEVPGPAIGTTSVTVEAWVRFNALDATTFSPVSGTFPGGTVFSTRELDGDQSPTLCVSPANGGAGAQKGAIFTFDSANDAMGAKGLTALQVGDWYYLAGTFEYTGTAPFYGNWNVYVNGNRDNLPVNNFRYAGSISLPFNGSPWRIGDQNQWTGGETSAAIDEVRLSGTARSADWIRAQFLSMSDTFITFGAEAFAVSLRIEDQADGSGVEIGTRTIGSGASFTAYAISRDAGNNFVANVAVTWSLINRTGGVVDSDLVAAGDGRSAVFTGHAEGTAMIRALHVTLGEDSTGVITVAAGAPAGIWIEDRANGSGAEIDTRTVRPGRSFTAYAISRDASGNFVDNEAVTWSLFNRTGGVADRHLVAAADGRSATFTGRRAGTARIRAQHATLGGDVTGVITVISAPKPPVALFTYKPQAGYAPCELCFDASYSYDPDGQIVSYAWDFGDGRNGDGVNVFHTYSNNGDFLVTLKVTDNDGLSDTATARFTLQAFVVYPPLDVQLRREVNRSLFRKEAFHTVSWSPNPGNSGLTIASYRIYRKDAGAGDESFLLIGTVSGSSFDYVDGYLDASKKFVYAVTAVDSSGRESGFSAFVGN
jgi:hypothetical protein